MNHKLNITIMKKATFKAAQEYRTPDCQILHMSTEGVLCASEPDDEFGDSTIDGFNEKTESYW